MSRAPEDDGDPIDDDVLDDDDPYQERAHTFQGAPEAAPPRAYESRPPRANAWSEVFAEGDLVARKYYISGPEQRTGMLVTASARHLELEQSVSLTYLVAEACEDPARVARFLQDVKLVARVPSAHTAKVLDVGRLKSGSPYAALEKPAGWTFAEVLRVRGPLPVPEACDYAIQACRAVSEAHAVGVRAITLNMENLVLTRASSGAALVKTVLVGASSASPEDILQTDLFRGADASVQRSLVPHLAPEHLSNTYASDGARAAVWALGTILYELVAGTKVISARTPTGVLVAIAADAAPKLGITRSDVPAELEAVVERCLAKNPAHRYSSVNDLALALGPFVTGEHPERDTVPPRRVSRIPPPLPSVMPTARAIVRASTPPTGEQPIPRTVERAVTLGVGVLLGALVFTSMQALRATRPSGDAPGVVPTAAPQAAATATALAPVAAAPIAPAAAPQAAPTATALAPVAAAPVATTPPAATEPTSTPAAIPVSLRMTRSPKSIAPAASAATLALNEAASTAARTRVAAPGAAPAATAPRRGAVAPDSPAPSSAPAAPDETAAKPEAKHGDASEHLHAKLQASAPPPRDTDLFDDLP